MIQNKFAKQCRKCRVTVPAYAGVCFKEGDKWLVEHVDCNDVKPAAPVRIITDISGSTPPEWTDADWARISDNQLARARTPAQHVTRANSISLYNDDDENECYHRYGMSNNDLKDFINPDEGDRG